MDDFDHPDVPVFDLDPGEGIEWSFVVDSALALRELLRAGQAPPPEYTRPELAKILIDAMRENK